MPSQIRCLHSLKMQRRIGKPLNKRTMKKLFTFATLAMVAIVACNKEINAPEENVVPEDNIIQTEEPKGDVTIIAQAPAETKTMVDGLDVKWASGDHIAVLDEDGGIHDFSLDSGEGTTSGTFSGTLGGKNSLGYAIYPYSANADFDGSNITVDYPTTYTYDAVTVPMIGEEGTGENVGKYAFSHIGGAFKIQYTNVPAGATKFVFTSTTDITGTVMYDLTDAIVASNAGKEVTVTGLPSSSTLTFIIPVPVGSYSFSVKLLDSSDATIVGSQKTVSSAKSVAKGHLVPLKAIKVKADKDEVLWSEDFTGCEDASQPSTSTSKAYWGNYASYAYDGTYTKIYTTASLDSYPELLIAKSSRSETWVVSNIPSGAWTKLTLTYKANQNLDVSSSDVTVGDATYDEITDKYGTYTRILTVPSTTSYFSLTFKMKTDSNARIDDISLSAGAPDPTITVTTSAATATSSLDGTTATLNGSLALLNDAVNASVTEAGFYYKLTSAGAYTKVTCALAPTSTTTFSYDLTGLTKDSDYTYYAYAIYDGGSEITGKTTEKTFTPTKDSGMADVAQQTFTFSSLGYSNAEEVSTIAGTSNCSIVFAKGSNSNAPKYYNSGTAVRTYGGNTITVTANTGYKITSITLTFGSSDGTNAITSSTGTYDNGSWTGSIENGSSVVFTIGGTTGNRRISSIQIN